MRKDIEFLGQHFDVKYFEFAGKGAWGLSKALILQGLFLLRWGIGTRRIMVMFGGYNSLLPCLFGKIFRKQSYIILGGTDCVSYPSIDYGTFRKKWQGRAACLSYRWAHRLLPVHESLMYREETYYRVDGDYQGCRYWCKNLKTPHTTIFNGYDAAQWHVDASLKQPDTFITIAAITDPSKLVLKGIDLVIEVARRLPDCRFTIVGAIKNIDAALPGNITVVPFQQTEGLVKLLASARFYLQLSISEGFPNALCEAMLAQCIPICSYVAAMPDIVGDQGYFLRERNVDLLERLLHAAMDSPDQAQKGLGARERVMDLYPISAREAAFVELLQ